jgi:iron complex transport system ATP-binding protein
VTLRAEKLRVEAQGRALIDAVECGFAPGRITAIIGPNGAGKTTLLRTLAGLEAPAGGSVSLEGRPLATIALRERAQRVGYLPQDSRSHWAVSVRTLVGLGRLPYRGAGLANPSPADAAAVDRALAMTDAADMAERTVDTLSGGERARVMLARVLAGEPQWLLADEPFAALDIAHCHALAPVLRACAAAGQGVVVVMHDLSLALRLADDAVLMDAGHIVAQGPASVVLVPEQLEAVFGARFTLIKAPDGIDDIIVSPRFP